MSCYIDITDQPKPEQGWRYGHHFDAERHVEDMSIQDIINEFSRGETVDMRLVLHACELARKYNMPLTFPTPIGGDQQRFYKMMIHPSITVISGNSAEEQITQLQKIHEQYTVMLEETNRDPQFIQTQQLAVRNECRDQSSEDYIAQMAVRKSIDTVDVAPYFRSEGKLYIIAKLGIRPALLARDRMPHYISLSPTLSNVEGIS